MRNFESSKNYYGFSTGDSVKLISTISCENKVIDLNTEFKIISFPIKTTKTNCLVINEVFNEKEFSRDRFVYGITDDKRNVRTYICNIKKT